MFKKTSLAIATIGGLLTTSCADYQRPTLDLPKDTCESSKIVEIQEALHQLIDNNTIVLSPEIPLISFENPTVSGTIQAEQMKFVIDGQNMPAELTSINVFFGTMQSDGTRISHFDGITFHTTIPITCSLEKTIHIISNHPLRTEEIRFSHSY